MEKIASFTVDHLRLVPGVYVSRVDQVAGNPITTFDLRMTRTSCRNILTQSCRICRQNDLLRTNGMPYRILSDPRRKL